MKNDIYSFFNSTVIVITLYMYIEAVKYSRSSSFFFPTIVVCVRSIDLSSMVGSQNNWDRMSTICKV